MPLQTLIALCLSNPNALDTRMPFTPQVRWHTFQFLMDELVEELEELYLIVGRVLDALPHGV